jgi:hypothetical protein
MKDDFSVEGFSIPPHPKGAILIGKSVRWSRLILRSTLKIYTTQILSMWIV